MSLWGFAALLVIAILIEIDSRRPDSAALPVSTMTSIWTSTT